MNARLYPMSRRCRYCGTPLQYGRLCAEHRSLERVDPMFALELMLSTTGAAARSEAETAAPGGAHHA